MTEKPTTSSPRSDSLLILIRKRKYKSRPCLGVTKTQKPLRLNPKMEPRRPNDPSSNPNRLGGCNNLTHGKAVFNNKEYGCHLLAQPNGSNVHATSLKYLIKTKCTKTIILRKVSLNFSGVQKRPRKLLPEPRK